MDALATFATFQNFCGSTFWNNTLTWDTAGQPPDLTQCFQETLLVWVPCGFLFFFSPFYLIKLLRISSRTPTPISKIHIIKLILGILLILLPLCDVVKYILEITHGDQPPLVLLVSSLILAFSIVLSLALLSLERRKGYVTSGVLFMFYFLLFVSGTFKFASQVLNLRTNWSDDDFRTVTFITFYAINLLMTILLCVAESHPAHEIDEKICPEVTASFPSRLTFWWLTSLIVRGYRKDLTEEDLFKLNPRDTVETTLPTFEDFWMKQVVACKWNPKTRKSPAVVESPEGDTGDRALLINSEVAVVSVSPSPKQKKPSLLKVLFQVFWWDLLVANTCELFVNGLTFAGPLLQSRLIDLVDDSTEPIWHGYFYAVMFFCLALVSAVLNQQMYHISMCMSMRVNVVLQSAIYKKALTISNQARKEKTVGEIVNLMSVDTNRVKEVLEYLWIVWSCPLQISIALYLLYKQLGVAIFAGIGALVLLIPLNGYVATVIEKLQIKLMEFRDSRIKILNEILSGIKVLKFYAWEVSFKDKVGAIRSKEVSCLKRGWNIMSVSMVSWMVAPFLVMLTTFVTFVMTGHVLDAKTAFVSLTLFNILQFPINLLPMLLSFMVTAKVSLDRIGDFLRQPDIEYDYLDIDNKSELPIEVLNGKFAWGTEEEDAPVLKNINLQVGSGSTTAVVGLVGSGKSSLLSAVLGEMERLEGYVTLNGSTAFVAQQAWIQNATLRDNILFGKPYDETRYNKVVEACALTSDLEVLAAGDRTEIGEKGINLSGGQKQRVALARAVYQDLDIYLFDDPLSAVDAHVGKHIFENVIGSDGLLKNKTRVLVTHGVHWLPLVDQIVVMKEGEISEMGSYEDLLHHNGPFAQFLKTYLLEEQRERKESEVEEEDPEISELQRAVRERIESICSEDDGSTSENSPSKEVKRQESVISRQLSKVSQDDVLKEIKKEEKRKAEEKLIEAEEAETGRVKFTVFLSYIKALGKFNFFWILVTYIIYQGSSVFANIWLTRWTSDPLLGNSSIANTSEFVERRDLYLGVYGGSGLAQAVFCLIFYFILANGCVVASARLHSSMLFSILRSPMSFFDTTPVGRILNRFSRDFETVDDTLPSMVIQVFTSGFTVMASVFVISFSTPIFLALLIPLAIVYYMIQRFYIPTSRQLKRLESNTRSPVYAHFSESVSGVATIRAFKKQEEFEQKSFELINNNNVFYFANVASNRWLSFYLDVMGGLILFGAALFAVIEEDTSGAITGGIAGLSISYALQSTTELNWFVTCLSEFELNLVSVERIDQYVKVTPEAEWNKDSTKPSLDWPMEGKISFENYSTRYRPGLDLVVKDLDLRIKSQEKVGICGRTGAGKSSLATALFRIIESVSGNIVIDDIPIDNLGLHDLRSRLTILPQDPVLFSGTLRMNLDPVASYTDSDLWWAVEKAHLKSFVEGLPAGLDHECEEGGQNLSVGQRQLVCLARALLRKTRVLVLDEATAAVDMETDSLIQETIKTEFKNCTILTIAHRLNTIMDSDRILVLDKGQVVEFDTPSALLADQNSSLYQMAQEAGLV